MRYRIPGRPNGHSGNVGGFADDYVKDPFGALYDKIPEENKQKSREDSDTLSDYVRDPVSTLYDGGSFDPVTREAEEVTDPAKIPWIPQGASPPPDEEKDEETSHLVWVAGLGAAGVLAYLLLKK